MFSLKPHQRVYGIFFVFALSMGALLSRLPDLQHSLKLTEGQLGLTLIAMSIGALCGLTFSSPLIEKMAPAPPPSLRCSAPRRCMRSCRGSPRRSS